MAASSFSSGRAAIWLRRLRPWWHAALDLAFPPRCHLCGAACGCVLCPACIAAFPVARAICQRCGLPLDDGAAASSCAACAGIGAVAHLRAGGVYAGSLREVLLALKFDGRIALARPLGAWLAETIAADAVLAAADLIVPVPLHAARLRARGFNQAEEIAVAVGERLGKPVSTSLVRTRETAPQSSLNAVGRSQNLGGAFAAPTPLPGRAPLLIDDVVTTGATLASCAEVLVAAGARVVLAAAVARTPRPR